MTSCNTFDIRMTWSLDCELEMAFTPFDIDILKSQF